MYVCKVLIGNEHGDIPNQKLEVAISSFLTRRFYLTDKVPGICPIFLTGQGDSITEIIRVDTNSCPTIEDTVLGRHAAHPTELRLCQLSGKTNLYGMTQDQHNRVYFPQTSTKYRLMIMEDQISSETFLDYVIDTCKIAIVEHMEPTQAIAEMDRFLFQIVFTLAVIQEQYPGFVHGDLALRNLMIRDMELDSDLVTVYHFGGQQWHHVSGGVDVVMIDFGQSMILPDPDHPDHSREFSEVLDAETTDTTIRQNTQCDDIWWCLRGLHQELVLHAIEARIPKTVMHPLLHRVERLLDMEFIRELQESTMLDLIGELPISLHYFPKILATAKTPKEYLLQGYFDHMRMEDVNEADVFRHFNHPNGPQAIGSIQKTD